MSRIIRNKIRKTGNVIKTYRQTHVQQVDLVAPHTVDNFTTLSAFDTFINPFITFDYLFFSGKRKFIVDFLFKTNSETDLFYYDPEYNGKLGSVYSNGDATPPDPNYTGNEPLHKFEIIFSSVDDPETGEFLYDAIKIALAFDVENVRVYNPIYAPDYVAGDPKPAHIADEYGYHFPAYGAGILQTIRDYPKVDISFQRLEYAFKLPDNFVSDEWHQYSVHIDFYNNNYSISIDNEILPRDLVRQQTSSVSPGNEEQAAVGIIGGPEYIIPTLNESRIFINLAYDQSHMSELRFWEDGAAQSLLNKYAFKRIDFKEHTKLLYYYPLNNYSNNNPVQLTDLKAGNNGSLGKENLTDPLDWDDDEGDYPAFEQIVKQPVRIENDLESITISWEYDDLFDITGFDVFIGGNKYNNQPLPLASANEYKITGLTAATNYDIEVRAIGPVRVVDNFSIALSTSTVDPNASDAYKTALTLMDSYGDGWDDGYISIVDDVGNEIFNGTLQGASEKIISLQLENIEYCATATGSAYPSEVSWEIHLEDGTLIAQGGSDETVCFTPPEEYVPPKVDPIVVSDKSLAASNVQSDQFTVENTFATSNTGSNLTYTIYASQSPNLDGDVASIKANAEASQEFLISQFGVYTSIYNLSADTLYYYNLVVEDTEGNALAYTMNSVKTLPSA